MQTQPLAHSMGEIDKQAFLLHCHEGDEVLLYVKEDFYSGTILEVSPDYLALNIQRTTNAMYKAYTRLRKLFLVTNIKV